MAFGIEEFTFAVIFVFLPSLPLTHGLGLIAHCSPSARIRHVLLYPFKGGRHHVIFQIIAWVRWPCKSIFLWHYVI